MTNEPSTSVPPPLDITDEALHAIHDGEATTEERRLVARRPDAAAELAELATTAGAIGEVAPLSEEVLLHLRSTALDRAAADDDRPSTSSEDSAPVGSEHDAEGGADDLAVRRQRKQGLGSKLRRLPLPAVAAVVILLAAVGVGLIATADDNGEATATADASADAAEESDIGGAMGGHAGIDIPSDARDGASAAIPEASANDAEGDSAEAAGHGGDEAREALMSEAIAYFDDDDALRGALEAVDPLLLDLEDPGVVPDRSARAFAPDPRVRRCDTVVRSTDTTLQAAQAARIVGVGDQPVLVLSNPVSATAEQPASLLLTFVDADTCIPRGAVQR